MGFGRYEDGIWPGERRLDALGFCVAIRRIAAGHPALYGIYRYHADTLPGDALRHGLFTHSSRYISETRSRLNPYLVEREAFAAHTYSHTVLDTVV